MAFVGRGGEKMSWALEAFGVEPAGWVCCDLGCNVGGFVDALLQQGASRVYAVDTGYGTLDWKLRNHEQVVVMERTNALYVELPEQVDLVTCDVGWTRQRRVLPKAISLLKEKGEILSLVKPQYEAAKTEIVPGAGRVRDDALERIESDVAALAQSLGHPWNGPLRTPFLGGKAKNPEYFLHLGPVVQSAS